MLKRILTPLLVLFIATMSFSQEFSTLQTTRMKGLCKVWGYVKYFHPKAVCDPGPWDTALLEAIPKVLDSKTDEEYVSAVQEMVQKLGDPLTTLDSGSKPKPKNQSTESSDSGKKPYVKVLPGDIAVLIASDEKSNKNNLNFTDDFHKAIEEASKHSTIVIDIRNVDGMYDFYRSIPSLLTKPARMPSHIMVSRSGYVSEREPIHAYSTTLQIREQSSHLIAESTSKKHLVFLVNQANKGFVDGLAALQASGQAYIVQEGVDSLLENYIKQVKFEPNLTLNSRYTLLCFESGMEGFIPDEIVQPDKDPLEAAIKAAKKKKTSSRAKASNNKPIPMRIGEDIYPDKLYPSKEYRILGLFKLWNTIEYFFPYQDLMDQPWDEVLDESLPKVINARNNKEYALAIAECATKIQDSHVKMAGPSWAEATGTYRPNIIIQEIEGKSVVVAVNDPKAKKAGIKPGDLVASIAGEPVEKRREWLAKYYSVSTPDVLWYRVNAYLLAGPEGEPIDIVFETAEGKKKKLTLDRNVSVGNRIRVRGDDDPVYTVLAGNIGYVDLDRILAPEVDAAIDTIKDTDGLILDMRGYPVSGSYPFFMSLFSKSGPAAKVEQVEYDGLNARLHRARSTQSVSDRRTSNPYKNPVTVLINETAQSSAEHACLYMETGLETVFIGSPTSGANGVITYVEVPGELYVRFTGMVIKHGDGGQLQRMGIQPCIESRPTIAGIRAGKDEVLERALQYFKSLPKGNK